MRQTGAMKHPSTALRQTMKNRFLSPVTRVFRKRFLTTCLTTDSRGVCGNSGVKSCEEHSQQSKNGYKASEKVKKLLFKSLGPSGREFESPISDHNWTPVLIQCVSKRVSSFFFQKPLFARVFIYLLTKAGSTVTEKWSP